MRIGVLCPSEIAIRRFMPSLNKIHDLMYVGVGINSATERYGNTLPQQSVIDNMLAVERNKASIFVGNYGGKIFGSYEEMLTSDELDAVYIPLPPALHFKWAKMALNCRKHVLLEKPSTTCAEDTNELISIASKASLALHENYMFGFHAQLEAISDIIYSRKIGEVRLYRISFGFPLRTANDFRYDKALGGGALIDAGGYTIKYATKLLGESAKVVCAQMNYINGFNVDMYGSGTMANDNGLTVQLAFGMDNNYKCELEVWGSRGCLISGRILTAPDGFVPTAIIRIGNKDEVITLPADDAFEKSIVKFCECVQDKSIRESNYKEMSRQAQLVDEFRMKSNKD